MKSNFLKNRIGGGLLGLSLLLGIGIATSDTAQAQWPSQDRRYEQRRDRDDRRDRRDRRQNRRSQRNGRFNDGYGDYGGSIHLRQTALNEGFNEGLKQGRRDRERNERYDFTDESDYQKGTKSYSSRLGDRYIYQRYFREAFSHGYADGYAGY